MVYAGYALVAILAFLFVRRYLGGDYSKVVEQIRKAKKKNLEDIYKKDIEAAKIEVKEVANKMKWDDALEDQKTALEEIKKRTKIKDDQLEEAIAVVEKALAEGNTAKAEEMAGFEEA